MAGVNVAITGGTTTPHGEELELTASATDDDGDAIADADIEKYTWSADKGSISGTGKTVTYVADLSGNAEETAIVTCEIELVGTDPPALTTVGANSAAQQQLNNIGLNLVTGIISRDDDDDHDLIQDNLPRSTTEIAENLHLDRVTFNQTSNRITIYRRSDDTGTMAQYWGRSAGDPGARHTKSLYLMVGFIGTGGTPNIRPIFQLKGTDIEGLVGNSFARWNIGTPSNFLADNTSDISFQTFIDFLDATAFISPGQGAFVIADTDSAGEEGESDSETHTITVTPNQAPDITAFSVPNTVGIGESIDISVTASDPEGGDLTYEWQATDPDGMVYSDTFGDTTAATTTYTGPSNRVQGRHIVKVTITDPDGQTQTRSQTVTVNDPPTVQLTTGLQAVTEVNDSVMLQAVVADPEDTITGGQWEIRDSNGVVSTTLGTISNETRQGNTFSCTYNAPSSQGAATVRFTATDQQNTTGYAETSTDINDAPNVALSLSANTINIDETVTLTIRVTDHVNDTITSVTPASMDGTFGDITTVTENEEYTVVYTPYPSDGEHVITVSVIDNHGGTTTATITVSVNALPGITLSNFPEEMSPGDKQTLIASVTDESGVGNTYPRGAWTVESGGGTLAVEAMDTERSINGDTVVFEITYTAGSTQEDVTIRFTATDNTGSSTYREREIRVNAGPTIHSLAAADSDLNANEETTITAVASDAFGDIESLRWESTEGSTIEGGINDVTTDSQGRSVFTATYKATNDDVTDTIKFTVADEYGKETSDTTTITINAAPVTNISVSRHTISQRDSAVINVTTSDPHGVDKTTQTWDILHQDENGDFVSTTEHGTLSDQEEEGGVYTVKYTPPPDHDTFPFMIKIAFSIQDNDGATAETDIEITVQEVAFPEAVDITTEDAVSNTVVAGIYFDDYALPITFRVVSVTAGRRLTQSAIQARQGQVQQTTYEDIKRIRVEGQIKDDLFVRNEQPLNCESVRDEIIGKITTPDDRELFIREGRYYKARLSNHTLTYIPKSNRTAATLTLEFIASDPYLYNETPISQSVTQPIGTAGGIQHFSNEGNTDTPLKIIASIASASAESVKIEVFEDPNDSTPAAELILDSPGKETKQISDRYQQNDQIVIDSAQQQILLVNSSGSKLIFHHIRDQAPIQNLPINLGEGRTKIGFGTEGTGTITIRFDYTERWI